MSEDFSKHNTVLYGKIIESLKEILIINREITIQNFLTNYSGNPDATEIEITGAIKWASKRGYILLEKNNPYYNSKIRLSDIEISPEKGDFQIVISIPKNTELGLSRVISRNQILETRVAFRKI